MPNFILVSFCNIPTITTSPLVCLKISGEETGTISYAPVSLGFPDLAVTATGLTSEHGKIYVLFITRWNKLNIAALQEDNLLPIYHQELPEVKDGHSILAFNNTLYVVSTGTDEIFSYDIKEKSLENPRVFWRASDSKTDTHHINSIIEKNGDILISAFGPKAGPLWSAASNGYIYNITSNSLVASGIYHPHSLSIKDERVYYTDSQRNSFRAVGEERAIFDLDGYTRGISWLNRNQVCIATSIGRRISKSTGFVTNPADPGEAAGECGLLIGNVLEGRITRKIGMSWYGPEIYDLLTLQESEIDLLLLSNMSQRAERQVIQGLSRQLVEWHHELNVLKAKHEEQVREVSKQNSQIQTLRNQLTEITSSKAWRFALIMRNIRIMLLPPNSWRARSLRRLYSTFSSYFRHRSKGG